MYLMAANPPAGGISLHCTRCALGVNRWQTSRTIAYCRYGVDTGNRVFHENADKGAYDTYRLTGEVPRIESDGSTDTSG